jgi:hypothetical protein
MPRIPHRWKLHLAFPLSAWMLANPLPASILQGQQVTLIQTTFPDAGIPPSPGQPDQQRNGSALDHPRGIDESCPIANSGIDLSFPMAESISEFELADRSQLPTGLDTSPTCPLEVQRIPESISVGSQPEAMAIAGAVPEGKLTGATLTRQVDSPDDSQAATESQKEPGKGEQPSEPPFRLKEEYRSYDAPSPLPENSVPSQPQRESSSQEEAEASDSPRLVTPPDEGAAPAPSEKREEPIAPVAPSATPQPSPSVPSPAIAEPEMEMKPRAVAPAVETFRSESGMVACAQPDQGTPPSPIARPVLRNRPASTILQKMRRLWERCTSGNRQTEGQIPTLDQLPSIQNIHRLPMPWHYQLPVSKIASLPWVEYPLTDRWHLTLPASLPSYRMATSINDPQSLVHDIDRRQQSPTNDLWIQSAKQIGRWLGTQVRRPRQWDRAETAQWLFYLWR